MIYVAKSMLELTLAERELGQKDPMWKKAAQRHYASAKRAVDQLVASQGDFQTEGELTFEDGMISCSALQIGMLALMQEDEKGTPPLYRRHVANTGKPRLPDPASCTRRTPPWRNYAILGSTI